MNAEKFKRCAHLCNRMGLFLEIENSFCLNFNYSMKKKKENEEKAIRSQKSLDQFS